MNSDETAILDYLKSWPGAFVAGREIARRVGGKKRYADDRGWAVPILREMVTKDLLESDTMGHYRLKPEENDRKKKKNRLRRHVSPQILRILRNSGKSFESIVIDEDPDETPAQAPATG